jgi:hypothetical protein
MRQSVAPRRTSSMVDEADTLNIPSTVTSLASSLRPTASRYAFPPAGALRFAGHPLKVGQSVVNRVL